MSETEYNPYQWQQDFKTLWEFAVEKYRSGARGADTYFDAEQTSQLAAFGYNAQELYDFAEDFVNYGDPTYETALLVASIRRGYFLMVQKGQTSTTEIDMSALPPKDAEVDGIVWLPRILPKAWAKLKGEMPADLMYGCGGDRRFFRANNIHPVEFLSVVWHSSGDDAKVIEYVKACRARATT